MKTFLMTVKITLTIVMAISVDNNVTSGNQLENESDCHTTLITSKGSITSRPFGDDLQPWLHCDWLVILPERSSVRLNFLSFDLPPAESGHCKQGFLLLGIVDKEGNRRSELGPVCGADSPGAIPLPTDKFWVSLFRVPADPAQRLIQYSGFSLNFTQVLNPVHGSAGIDVRWYALILVAAPILSVIPLYVCLRKRRSIPLYCNNPNTSEMVAERFQKKHRPHFRSILNKSGNIRITISRPSEDEEGEMSGITEFSYNGGSGDYENVKNQHKHRDDFSLFKNLYVPGSGYLSSENSLDSPVFIEGSQINNKSQLNSYTKSKFLTIPMQSNRKSRTSYLSLLPDFESTLDHSKIQSTEQLSQASTQPVSLASIGQVDDKAVYVIQDPPSRDHPVIPLITITSASLRRKKRLSTVKNPEDTSANSALLDRKTGQRFRGSLRPCKHARVWQSEDDSSSEAGDDEPDNREPDKIEPMNRENTVEPVNTEPVNTESGFTDPCLTGPDNKELTILELRNAVEPGNTEPDNTAPGSSTPSLALEFQGNKSGLDSHFGFSTPSILLYRTVDHEEVHASLDNECLPSSLISLIDMPHTLRNVEPDNDRYNGSRSSVLADEIRILQEQLSQPQVMGVDNVAFESGDDARKSWELKQCAEDGEPDNGSKVTIYSENCGNSG